ncbi:MAG: MCE family protein [Candidatus Aminicenantes bacterium]|nr:MCE family protein [Candidatus Aminicenantes bacterium]
MTKQQKARLGIFLVMSLVVLFVVLAIFLVPTFKEAGNTYFVNFKGISVNGLFEGSSVKYQGVEVGRVDRIVVNPSDINSILVYVEVNRGFDVKKDMTASLMYMGVTGQKFVELSGGTNESENLKPNGEITTRRGLGKKAEDIVSNIDHAVQGISNLLDVENQERIALFLDNVEKSSEILSDVLETRKESLEESVTNIQKASRSFSEVTENLREVTEDLSQITEKLEASSGSALENLNKRLSDEEMGQVLTNLQTFIDTASGSLDKIETVFIYQQEELRNTFESLSQAIDNLSQFSRELIEDPTLFIRTRKEKKK